MSRYEVVIIKAGYAKWAGPTQQHADGSITLVTGPKKVIVDTGGPWNRDYILTALRRIGLKPGEIDYVVCTHGHSDHTGNNNLFPNATLILSYDICKGDLYTFHDFTGSPYKIDEDLEVISTPGHTGTDVSVLVVTPRGVVAIVGDLFESAEDRENESLWRSFSENQGRQQENRGRVLELADFIVPGHGEMFPVKRKQIQATSQQPPGDDGLGGKLTWHFGLDPGCGTRGFGDLRVVHATAASISCGVR